jgi:hypothetical protein
MVFFIKIIGNYLLKIAIFSLIKLELEWANVEEPSEVITETIKQMKEYFDLED